MTSSQHPITDEMRERIREALREDIPSIDVTSAATVSETDIGSATFIAKADGILAGIDVALEVFALAATGDIEAEKFIKDGEPLAKGTNIATVNGPLRTLLAAERTALNLLQRMSGIATATHRYVDAVRGTKARILDTRKTAPLLRPFDRYAVRTGGGENHRYSLSDMVLVKDNHIAANGGSIELVIRKLKEYFAVHPKLQVEIEVTSLEQFSRLLATGTGTVDRVMFDNFSLLDLRKAVTMNAVTFETEASGGITLDTVRNVAETGVDCISVGALTHSVTALDISLEM